MGIGNFIFSLRDWIPFTIGLYPVQRHKFPDRESWITLSEGFLCFSFNARAAITKPGVQNPHCDAALEFSASIKGLAELNLLAPSIVTIFLSSICPTFKIQEFTGARDPFSSKINTEHAPQSPSEHPSFVPVNLQLCLKKFSKLILLSILRA